jgi:hypothetical protein
LWRAIASRDGRTVAPSLKDWFVPYELAVGVGNDEDASAKVRGAGVGS